MRYGDYAVYKPRKGQGTALKLNLRLEQLDGSREWQGGLFLALAPEGPEVNGNPQFFNQPGIVQAKLGLRDVTTLLTAIQAYRAYFKLPPSLRRGRTDAEREAAAPNQLSLFHQTGDGTNTAIGVTFEPNYLDLRVSKGGGATVVRSIRLDLPELLGFERYLELALDAYLRAGIR